MRVHVTHDIGDLADDLAAIPAKVYRQAPRIVKRNVEQGNRLAQNFARAASGPHGRLYYRRITAEMTGALEGEYGPTGNVAGNAVGAGWRNGPGNTDLPRSADVQGPKFADDIADMVDRLFW
jgi:hypothetical protein